MAITLDPDLKTAQDGIDHRLLVELTSSPAESVIPYRGNFFNVETTNESNQALAEGADGRLVNLYIKSSKLYLYYTNTDKTEWQTPVLIYDSKTVLKAACCILVDGNVGVILVTSGYDIKRMVVTTEGSVVTSAGNIESGLDWIGKPGVARLMTNEYLLVYPTGTEVPPDLTGTYTLKQKKTSDFTTWS